MAASRPRTLKAAHVSRLDFPGSRQAIKITRRRRDAGTGKISRQTVYAVTSLTSSHATAQDLARLVREHWSIEMGLPQCELRRSPLAWLPGSLSVEVSIGVPSLVQRCRLS